VQNNKTQHFDVLQPVFGLLLNGLFLNRKFIGTLLNNGNSTGTVCDPVKVGSFQESSTNM
jgi:hypothetical protein